MIWCLGSRVWGLGGFTVIWACFQGFGCEAWGSDLGIRVLGA